MGPPLWTWSRGERRCLYRECGCRTVGVVAAAEEAGVTAELLPPWFGDGRVGSAVHVVNWWWGGVAAVGEAKGRAGGLPPWLRPRDKGEVPLP